MSVKEEKKLSTGRVVGELKRCGVTHIVWLPDSKFSASYDAMISDPGLTCVQVCREGEAIAVAAGLILGGKVTATLIQNTGLFEAGDSIRGIALGFKLPMLLLIGYTGWQHGAPLTHSAAVFTEPVLDTWGIRHYLVETDDDVDKMSVAYREASESNKPVAVLIAENVKP